MTEVRRELEDMPEVKRIELGGVWDIAWGGGIISTSTTLFGGGAGVGKTTALLKIAALVAKATGRTSHYITSEESVIGLGVTLERLGLSDGGAGIRVTQILEGEPMVPENMLTARPGLFVLDSITALCHYRKEMALETVRKYKKLSSKYEAPVIFSCHMTKDNDYEGLNAMQHEVDVLMTIGHGDGDAFSPEVRKLYGADRYPGDLRVLTCWKNRYGYAGRDFPLVMTPRGLISPEEL